MFKYTVGLKKSQHLFDQHDFVSKLDYSIPISWLEVQKMCTMTSFADEMNND